MDNYIVSARKYRPNNFELVVGQDAITQTLKNAIRIKQLAQAYLFCGPRGIGKTTCARIFAKTINCTNPNENYEACDACESCVAFNKGRSLNIHELDAASNNSVEDIRNLIEQVRIPPQLGNYSVYIIDEVHMLSGPAFNAFLKTLEEPPKYVIFILATTEKHKIIPTILSRCQIFDFNRIGVDDIRKQLSFVAKEENIEAEEDALHIIAQKADGAMRDALSIFDQIVSFCGKKITYSETIKNLNVLDYEIYFKITEDCVNGNYVNVLNIFDEILKKGFEANSFINGLASHFRNLLVCKNQANVNLLEVGEKTKKDYIENSNKTPVSFLFKAIDIANDCDLNYKASQNKRLYTEISLLKICNISNAIYNEKSNENIDNTISKTTNSEQNTIKNNNQAIISNLNTIKSISLKEIEKEIHNNITNKINEPSIETANKIDTTIYSNTSFDEQQFKEAWLNYAKTLELNNPRLFNFITCNIPIKIGNTNYQLSLGSISIKNKFEMLTKDLLNFMKTALNNQELTIEYIIEEATNNNVRFRTDKDKIEDLIKTNPETADLIQKLKLDIE